MVKVIATGILLTASLVIGAVLSKGWYEHIDDPKLDTRYSVKIGLRKTKLCTRKFSSEAVCETVANKELPKRWPRIVDPETIRPILHGVLQADMPQRDVSSLVSDGVANFDMRLHDELLSVSREYREAVARASGGWGIMNVAFFLCIAFGGLLALVGLWSAVARVPGIFLVLALLGGLVSLGVVMGCMVKSPQSVTLSFSFWFFTIGACGSLPLIVLLARAQHAQVQDWIEPTDTGAW